jgi:hypothetical protein
MSLRRSIRQNRKRLLLELVLDVDVCKKRGCKRAIVAAYGK